MDTSSFNINGPSVDNGNYFGFPFTPHESELVIMSVPWDVTTSYGGGTAKAPRAIINASLQMDLYDVHNPQGWKRGIGTIPINEKILVESIELKREAHKIIKHLESGGSASDRHIVQNLRHVNEASARLNDYVSGEARKWLAQDKIVGLVGGDHSVPLGLIDALAKKHDNIGILHIDAHADLRTEYEGFKYSHASVMNNVMRTNSNISSLVQVSVRDFCEEEVAYYHSDERISVFTDHAMSSRCMKGESWDTVCEDIISHLPRNIYVSFDIDGLTPDNCPNTGTPVPGGLSFNQAVYLLAKVVESGACIVGFDLCEVSPATDNEWDANVGARILYKLCNLALKSK